MKTFDCLEIGYCIDNSAESISFKDKNISIERLSTLTLRVNGTKQLYGSIFNAKH